MKKTGIIISARTDSSRIKNKVLTKINGTTLIEHLIGRLKKTGLPIYIAAPSDQVDQFHFLEQDGVHVYGGLKDDVLQRVAMCAVVNGLDTVVRVTCDKIFVDSDSIVDALSIFNSHFLQTSNITDGARFEIFSTELLKTASSRYRNVEHITYAASASTAEISTYKSNPKLNSNYRFLIDYPEDLNLISLILASVGNECTLMDAINFMNANQWADKINKLPEITIYTCAKNAEKYISECMGSASAQTQFKNSEYLLIDDSSSDDTTRLMAKFSTLYKNVRFIRNSQNIGLASSSNIALAQARGKWIIRLDADDWFTRNTSIDELLMYAKSHGLDAVYPDNFCGGKKIQSGSEHHHVGGALFNTRAMNTFKFTDGLRGYEGYDFFERANSAIKIGYYKQPVFNYRQRHDSMSNTNLLEREKLKQSISVSP